MSWSSLTLSYASQLADMQPNDFRQLLKQRNVPLYPYDEWLIIEDQVLMVIS
ncbi:MAG: UPF0175 family protein [Nostoc sp. EfeVER01]|uniref:UPF0175 family protein n=1 Tax=unclassified Nostoc TaxID=2593658 RepID=UPI002AD41697|nr:MULTISPECIES: UPF0175 family protein [unclassified Nostoc]MDZ7945017.1 UPF0175 family protein [Nostoc sp. EfeVER01]MDZ7991614.1 UPF0175 family protein [Nostoc sp. EspVER01]